MKTWLKKLTTVFILGRGIAGIPHFCKKSPKLSDTMRDKSPHFKSRRYNIQNTVIPLGIRTEKINFFFLCLKTKGNYFHTVRKFRESLMPIICQKVSIPKYTV